MSNPVAVVDIGTNSALLLIARRQGRRLVAIHEETSTPRLGEMLGRTGRIGHKATENLIKILRHYQELVREHHCQTFHCVGTRVFRAARNAASVCDRVKSETGLDIIILSAVKEAQLTLRGALSGLSRLRHGVLIDVGGGSTEFIGFANRKFQRSMSVNIGAVNLADSHLGRFYHIGTQRLTDARTIVNEHLEDVVREYLPAAQSIVGVGGTITTLAAMRKKLRQYRSDRIHGQIVPASWVKRQLNHFRNLPIAELRRLIPYEPERANVLPAGTFIWDTVLNMFTVPAVQVSHRGLRWGVAEAITFGRKGMINSS